MLPIRIGVSHYGRGVHRYFLPQVRRQFRQPVQEVIATAGNQFQHPGQPVEHAPEGRAGRQAVGEAGHDAQRRVIVQTGNQSRQATDAKVTAGQVRPQHRPPGGNPAPNAARAFQGDNQLIQVNQVQRGPQVSQVRETRLRDGLQCLGRCYTIPNAHLGFVGPGVQPRPSEVRTPAVSLCFQASDRAVRTLGQSYHISVSIARGLRQFTQVARGKYAPILPSGTGAASLVSKATIVV